MEAVTQVSADGLKRALPFVLGAVLVYTLMRKELGRHHTPRFHGANEALLASAIGLTLPSSNEIEPMCATRPG